METEIDHEFEFDFDLSLTEMFKTVWDDPPCQWPLAICGWSFTDGVLRSFTNAED